ncbi:MAG: radical SAM/SPASM domain-containing protein [Candidatus Hodarchaeota archaeon]
MNSRRYVPETCVWELTLRCNMKCIHCGSSAGEARANELTVVECIDVADELLDLGCRHVTLIGGEVFLYEGWERIARVLSDGGAAVNIITNAFRLEDKEVDQIRYANLANVGISVDGMEKNHNRIRNNSTSFDKVLRAFQRLREERIPSAVVTSLLNFNLDDLEPMYKLFMREGVNYWQLQIATAMGSMLGESVDDLLLNPNKIPWITSFIKRTRRDQMIRMFAADNIGYYDENELYLRNAPGTLSPWKGCQAGLRVVGIDSVGNVRGCQALYAEQFIEGNLLEESLSNIWHKDGGFAYNRQFSQTMLTGKCARCDKAQICRGGCRSSCYFTTGRLYENIYCCYNQR